MSLGGFREQALRARRRDGRQERADFASGHVSAVAQGVGQDLIARHSSRTRVCARRLNRSRLLPFQFKPSVQTISPRVLCVVA
jgi:hypothetical protein